MWEYWERRAVPAKQRKPATTRKPNHKNTQINNKTRKQESQIINTQKNKTIKT